MVYEQHQRILYRFAAAALLIFVLYIIGGMGAYIFQATDNLGYAVGGALTMGLLVAVAVANLDRSLLGSINVDTSDIQKPIDPNAKPPSKGKYVVGVTARVLIALAASYLFADTVAVELNRKSVEETIISQLSAQGGQLERQAAAIEADNEAQLRSLESQVTLLQNELTELTDAPARYEAMALAEADGEGSTRQTGCGEQCRYWQAQRDAALQRRTDQEPGLQLRLIEAVQALEGKEAEVAFAIAINREETIRLSTSPEAMSQTLLENAQGSLRGFARYFGLMILFLGIEMAVLLIKLIVSGGAYEQEVKSRVRLATRRSVAEYQMAEQEIHEKMLANEGVLRESVGVDADQRLAKIHRQQPRASGA